MSLKIIDIEIGERIIINVRFKIYAIEIGEGIIINVRFKLYAIDGIPPL